jgi:3-oxoacyl-[acyl-carrier-protein] synthase III
VFLHSLGHFHPENEIDNLFLEGLEINTGSQWILDTVGIRTRRTVLPLEYIAKTKNIDPSQAFAHAQYTNAKTGSLAAKMALERAGLQPSEIGLVIAGGCSPEHTTPSEACTIAAQLGIRCPAFDLNSACSSFAAQVHFLNCQREETLPNHILVVNAENNTRVINYTDRGSSVLWGDGTSAAILSPRLPSKLKLRWSTMGSDPSNWKKVVVSPSGHFFQEGSAVQTFAIKRSLALLSALREHLTQDRERLWFVGHQANLRMLQSVCSRGGISPERHLFNVDKFGNCGAAGAPSVLSQNWGRWESGDEIALLVVGAGLSWGALLFQVEH